MITKKIKKVLIAMDYDPTAQKVAEIGFSISKAMSAETILLHIVSDPISYTSPGHVTIMGFAGYVDMNPLQEDNFSRLKNASFDFLEKTKVHLGDNSIQILVKEGDLSETILKTAKSMHIDIIVMGSHSRKWLENVVMGSTTEKVLHQTSIPLFIVPTKKKE